MGDARDVTSHSRRITSDAGPPSQTGHPTCTISAFLDFQTPLRRLRYPSRLPYPFPISPLHSNTVRSEKRALPRRLRSLKSTPPFGQPLTPSARGGGQRRLGGRMRGLRNG
ncbi:hypothetical protein K523DRAFT_422295 [Schizophyllum commune Tattone D]|nr:hypothetical protein K523DRAFT_422295 [Schizophyllum commune Tattone D]